MLGGSDIETYSRLAYLEVLVKKDLDRVAPRPSRFAELLCEFITAIKRDGKPRVGTNLGNRAVVVEIASSKAM